MTSTSHGQKHTSDLKRSLVFVSWSAWTNLRCLAGRRPSDLPRAIQGAPFRAHAHDPTGEVGRQGTVSRSTSAFATRSVELRRPSCLSAPLPVLRSRCWIRFFRTGSRGLANPFLGLSVEVAIHCEGSVRTRRPLVSPPVRFAPKGKASCGRYTRRCTSSSGCRLLRTVIPAWFMTDEQS